MKTLFVYDRPLCCSTGICGPQVDPVLPRFAADLEWIKSQGCEVQRYNLAQQPMLFVENKVVHELLTASGTDCLPIVIVEGRVVSQREYPSRDQLAGWLGIVASRGLPVVGDACCGGSDCC